MEKMDNIMTCDVVRDLLPLYTDSACTEGSKRLVEEHIKTCEGCKKQLEEMGAPIEGLLSEPVREKSETEVMLADALKKMRANSKRVVTVCLAILIFIPLVVFCGRELTGQGLSLSNLEEYRCVETTVTAWSEKGSGAAVDSMSPLWLYNHVKSLRTDHGIFGRYNKTAAYNGDCSQGYYSCLTLMGENFYFPGEVLRDDGTYYRRGLKELYEAGDESGVLYAMMQYTDVVVPENLFRQIQMTHQQNWEDWVSFEFEGERYYFCTHGHPVKEEEDWDDYYSSLLVWVDLEPELYALIPELQTPDLAYCIAQNNQGLPEKLQRHFEQVYDEIYSAYQSYNRYYEDMGYDTFRDTWRGEMKELLRELEALGWSVDGAKLLSIARRTDRELNPYHVVTCRIEMGGTWVYMDFEARDYGEGVMGSVCVPMQITCFGAPEEVQQIMERINYLCAAGLPDLQKGVNVGMNIW